MHNQPLKYSQKPHTTRHSQALNLCARAQYSYKINLASGIKNPTKWILLAYFDPQKDLVIAGQVLAALAFSINRTPRTVKKQLRELENCKYYTLRKNEKGQFVVRFSDQKPLLKYTALPYRELAIKYGLTPIWANMLGILKQREQLGLRCPTQRLMAERMGCDKQSVVNGLKVLLRHDLIHRQYILADYIHPRAKKWRNVYGLTRKAYTTIRTLIVYSMNKLQRILSKSSEFTKTTARESHILLWFNKFKQKYPNSDDRSLSITLNGALKKIKTLPAETDIAAAWEIFMRSSVLKMAVHIGWIEAMKAYLVQKDGVINDRSSYWKKLTNKRINFYWFITHIPEILSGRYTDKALSEKAKRTWEDLTPTPLGGGGHQTRVRRPEAPQEELRQQIKSQTACAEETALRERLLGKYGPYAYENWFQACGYDAESGNLTHDSDFHRNEIERKYGLRVDNGKQYSKS